ncbi:MAG: hypothetical protein KDF24_01255 [Rhodocyclaceae bacterium]|nr:hypothetical protein [Rhodocyclaceae bacterium]MCB1961790.1 hypothetical protein [Rhodocyclaceae bacterium]
MGLFARRSETTQLSTQAFVLANERRRRVWLPLVLIIAVLAGVTYASVEYFDAQVAPMAQIDELERENAQLKAAVDEARMREELERATQAALEKQVTELNREVLRLKDELNFFKKADGKP